MKEIGLENFHYGEGLLYDRHGQGSSETIDLLYYETSAACSLHISSHINFACGSFFRPL